MMMMMMIGITWLKERRARGDMIEVYNCKLYCQEKSRLITSSSLTSQFHKCTIWSQRTREETGKGQIKIGSKEIFRQSKSDQCHYFNINFIFYLILINYSFTMYELASVRFPLNEHVCGTVFQQKWWTRNQSTASRTPMTAIVGNIWTTEADQLPVHQPYRIISGAEPTLVSFTVLWYQILQRVSPSLGNRDLNRSQWPK